MRTKQSHRLWIWCVLVLTLLIFWARILPNLDEQSLTVDEPVHLVRGLAYWRTGDLRLQYGHPPLSHALIGALPMLEPGLPSPTHVPGWADAQRLDVARQLVWGTPDRQLDRVVFLGRWPVLALGMLLAALSCRWATDLFGSRAGLIALFLCTFDPNLLAHASLATTDLPATCTIVAASYAFFRWTRQPTVSRLLLAGFALGLAWSAKLSSLILIPVLGFAVLWCATLHKRHLISLLSGFAGIALLGTLVLWALHRFETGTLAGFWIPMPTHWDNVRRLWLHQGAGHSAYFLGQLSHIGMLTACGIECLRRRFAWVSNGVITLITGLILLEYWVFPFPTVRVNTPAWYHQLAEDADQFAILDLPMDPVTFDKDYMAYQVAHGKALVGGKISRPTSEAFQFINERPFLRGLYEENDMDPALGAVSHQLAHLAEHDVRYIILHKGNLSAEKLARWRDWLTIEPTYESEALVVYQTEPRRGRDFELVHELTESVGLIRWAVSPTTTQQGGTVSIDVRWGSSAPVEREFDVKFSLVSDEGEIVQSVQTSLLPDWPTHQWSAHAVARGEYTLQVDPFAPAERLWLHLALTAKNEDVIVGEPVMLDTLTVGSLPRTFNVPSIEHKLSASFGSELDLLGYDLSQQREALEIILHWRARRPMAVPYKFFVHLYSREEGELAAQADVMPGNWTYPTTWWVEGEIVSDRVHLSMEDLQAGQYQLAVGVYHPDSGERLPVRGSPLGMNYKDGRMMLPLVIEH